MCIRDRYWRENQLLGGLKSAFTPGAPSTDFAPHHGHSAGRQHRISALQNQAPRALSCVHEKQSLRATRQLGTHAWVWAPEKRLRGIRESVRFGFWLFSLYPLTGRSIPGRLVVTFLCIGRPGIDLRKVIRAGVFVVGVLIANGLKTSLRVKGSNT